MRTRDGSKGIADLSPERRELLLRQLREKQSAEPRPVAALPVLVPNPAERHLPFPLSDVQQSYLAGRSGFFDLGAGGTNVYEEIELTWEHATSLDRFNLALQRVIRRWVHRPGFLDLDAYKTNYLLNRLNRALQQVIARQEMLRAVILPDGRQRILPQVPPYRIEVVDLRGKDAQMVEAERESVRRRMRTTKGRIDQWPLFEFLVHRLDGERLRLHIRIDTLLMDGFGRAAFLRELFQHLGNPTLPPLECSYRDYALTWLAFQESDVYRRAREHWLSRLPSMPPAPELPLAQLISPATPSYFTSRNLTLLQPDAWQRLKARAARLDLTPSGVVVAAFVEVLAAWSVNARFTLSMLGTHRPAIHPQINEVIGTFHTIYLLVVEHAPGTFEARARRLQQQMLLNLEHRSFSGLQVLREINRRQGGSTRAAMPILFNSVIEYGHPSYQHITGGARANSILSSEETDTGLHLPQLLILPTHNESSEGALLCKWQAIEEVFPAGLIQDMLDAYMHLLRRLAEEDTAWQEPMHRLVPAAQLEQRAAVNATDAPVPDGLLHSLFMAQVYLRPQQPALLAAGQSLTYAELAGRVTQVSHRLRELGARPNSLVAVVMEKGWEQVVAVLGVLRVGAAYLPIDPTTAPERLRALLDHGAVDMVLTQSWVDALLAWPERVQRLHVDAMVWEDVRDHPLGPTQSPEDLAYVIYTADSTCRLKGVKIDHRGAVNTILDINRRFGVGPGDRVLALSPLSFDLSVYDIFGALAAGATIVMPSAGAADDPAQWAELIAGEQVTIWNSAPALLDLLVAYVAGRPELAPRSLRLALLSRDWVPVALPSRLKALVEGVEVVGLGGAAETSIWSTLYPIESVASDWKSIPYGRPLANQRLHVLDEALEPRPVWVPGQIYISGVGLSKGYWRDTEQTRANFITYPRTGERLYRTGDMGRFLPDGNVEPLGREQDFQVTVHGYRAEPQRVETALEQHPSVRRAVVVAREDACGKQRLVAYVVANRGRPPAASELRYFLKARLPEYLLPSAIVRLPALPLTPDGKVDRGALPTPDDDRFTQPPTFVAPRDSLELQLVRIWEDLFDTQLVGVTDNFFDLGGDSLLAVRLLTQIRELFGPDLPLATFLQEATVEHLAQILREAPIEQMANAIGQKEISLHQQPVALPQLILAGDAERQEQPADQRTPAGESAAADQRAVGRGMSTFLLIWFGQLVSMFGSQLTGFALAVWVFQQTHSATQLTLIAFFTMLPTIVFSPLAGALVDRWDRRWTMMLNDAGGALATLSFVVLLALGRLEVWHIYIIVSIGGICNSFQFPAFSAITTVLVPREQLSRASGMVQLARGVAQLLAPVLAGVLVGWIGLQGIIAIDFTTCLFAIATLLIVHIPKVRASAEGQAGQGSLLREALYGWTYIAARPGLLGLLLFFGASNFLIGTVIVLAPPIILAFTTPAVLGTVLSVGGCGLLVGSVLMSVWGGPKRRVHGALGGVLLSGVGMILAGLAPSALLIGTAAFILTFGLPVIGASSQAIWQSKVAPDVQGRVFAIRSMIATASMPVAFLVSGPLADYVFNPLLVPGGQLAGSVGRIIGVGPGRGIGLLFIVLGILTLLSVAVGYMYPRLRLVEDELPDAVVEEVPAEAKAGEPGMAGPQPQLERV